MTPIAMAPPLIILNNKSSEDMEKSFDEGECVNSGTQDMGHLERNVGADSVIGLIDKGANQVLNSPITQEEVTASQESLVIS